MPLISVVIPTYNRSTVLLRAIDSILNQSFIDWELLIVDDCSTDDTQHVVDQISHRDSRVKYFKLPINSGANAARNLGIQNASSDIISFLDSDDVMHPDNLSKQHIAFTSNPALGISYVGADYYDGEKFMSTVHNEMRGNLESYLFLNLKGLGSSTSGFAVRRIVFDQVGCFDEKMASQQDLDFLVRAARFFYIDYLTGCNTKMYVNSNNRISDNVQKVILGEVQFMEKHQSRIRELGIYHHVARKLARKYAIYDKNLKMAYTLLIKAIRYKPFYLYAYLYALKLPLLYFKK
jgi:glycosyltransferase involved in cell wall biosynthesis